MSCSHTSHNARIWRVQNKRLCVTSGVCEWNFQVTPRVYSPGLINRELFWL